MLPGALAPYEQALITCAPLQVRHRDGQVVALDIARWLAAADEADHEIVRDALSPVLDIGCGPGRIVAALSADGRFAIGLDIAPSAVRLARSRGITALLGNVFTHVPAAGRWASVLLLDGNVGIGGDIDRLLARVRTLLGPTGTVIVETHPDPHMDESHRVRFVLADAAVGPEFPWSYIGRHALERAARRAGLRTESVRQVSGRTAVTLVRPAEA
jgi:SAM-dependent methyltransferase